MRLIPYLLVVPLAAAFLIPVLGKKMKNSPDILALIDFVRDRARKEKGIDLEM